MPLPSILKVYHRLNTTAKYKFDGLDYVFTPHETKPLPAEVANHFNETSVFKWDPAAETVTRALVVEGDPAYEVPYEGDQPMELIDRSTDPEPIVKRGMEDGKVRRTEYKVVQGSDADMKRKSAGVF